MIKIEFPAGDSVAAAAFATALTQLAEQGNYTPGAKRLSVGVSKADVVASEKEAAPDPKPEAAPSATDSSESGAPAAGGASVAKASGQTHDEHGVPFNPEFCGDAAKPFYASGADKGKWKKRQGVDKAAYDAWHAEELAKLGTTAGEEVGYDTAGAFGGQGQNTGPEDTPPANGGELFTWISEQTAAGNLDQMKINAGWTSLGMTAADVIPGNPNEVDNVAKVYGVLSQMAKA